MKKSKKRGFQLTDEQIRKAVNRSLSYISDSKELQEKIIERLREEYPKPEQTPGLSKQQKKNY